MTYIPSHQGRSIYLADPPLGNDANDGLSPERPVATWERAKRVSEALADEYCYRASAAHRYEIDQFGIINVSKDFRIGELRATPDQPRRER